MAAAADIAFAYTTLYKCYECSALKVKLFHRKAVNAGYNRILDNVGKMDLTKKAVARLVLPDHINSSGQLTTRVQFAYAVKGGVHPNIGFIDISLRDWREFCGGASDANGDKDE